MIRILETKENIKILCIGDFHTGSNSGLLPPKSMSFDGEIVTEILQSKVQKWLWRNYVEDLTTIGKVDIIINLGDNIEGAQVKIMGRTLESSDIDVQKDWSVKTLQTAIDICNPKFFLGVSGTNYHIRLNGNCNADLAIYKALEQVNPDVKFAYSDLLLVKIGRLTWSIAHAYPTTEFVTPPIEKLIKQHGLEYLLGNTVRIDVFVRGHAHSHIWERYRGGIYGFVTPCQQPTSAYGREKAYLAVRHPDIGILGIMQQGSDLIPKPLLHKWVER